MSITPVPISIRLVRAPTAASRGNGDASCRAKWCTRKYAPSAPSSSAATASSMDCCRASAPVRVCEPGDCDQCPNDRNPIFFMPLANTADHPDFRTPRLSSGLREHGDVDSGCAQESPVFTDEFFTGATFHRVHVACDCAVSVASLVGLTEQEVRVADVDAVHQVVRFVDGGLPADLQRLLGPPGEQVELREVRTQSGIRGIKLSGGPVVSQRLGPPVLQDPDRAALTQGPGLLWPKIVRTAERGDCVVE